MQRKILWFASSCSFSQTGAPFHPASSGSGSSGSDAVAATTATLENSAQIHMERAYFMIERAKCGVSNRVGGCYGSQAKSIAPKCGVAASGATARRAAADTIRSILRLTRMGFEFHVVPVRQECGSKLLLSRYDSISRISESSVSWYSSSRSRYQVFHEMCKYRS